VTISRTAMRDAFLTELPLIHALYRMSDSQETITHPHPLVTQNPKGYWTARTYVPYVLGISQLFRGP
jgi:hypothetical protein